MAFGFRLDQSRVEFLDSPFAIWMWGVAKRKYSEISRFFVFKQNPVSFNYQLPICLKCSQYGLRWSTMHSARTLREHTVVFQTRLQHGRRAASYDIQVIFYSNPKLLDKIVQTFVFIHRINIVYRKPRCFRSSTPTCTNTMRRTGEATIASTAGPPIHSARSRWSKWRWASTCDRRVSCDWEIYKHKNQPILCDFILYCVYLKLLSFSF